MGILELEFTKKRQQIKYLLRTISRRKKSVSASIAGVHEKLEIDKKEQTVTVDKVTICRQISDIRRRVACR
jgi:hypothetical protein